jgi:hypothetical protein
MSKSVDAAVFMNTWGAVAAHGPGLRWGQLVTGMACMALIANLQHGRDWATVPAVFTHIVR